MADISQIVSIDGNPYNLKDAKAREDIQKYLPLIPDFENATPIKTYTLSIAATSVYELCRRANTSAANGTNCSNLIDNIAFRLTITGTNINAVVDVVAFWQGAGVNPFVIVNNRTYSTSAATTGIRYLHFECPITLNDENYPWLIDFAAYNKTARSIKVEVFKTTENITWKETTTATIYNADYWTRQSLTLYTTRGIITNTGFISTMKVSNATTADKAGYITSYLTQFLTGVPPVAGEALIKNSLVYISDNKIWEASNKTKPILTDIGTMCCTSAYASGGSVTYTYFRQKSQMTDLTQDPNLVWTSFSKGDPLYLRCTVSNGNVYSDAYVSTSMAPGYTWGYIGIAETSTAALVDGGKTFITLDSNGYLTHVNGKEIASGGGGTVVSANPSLSGGESRLSSIGIDGVNYEVPYTSISATTDSSNYLSEITVGSTTYSLMPASIQDEGQGIEINIGTITAVVPSYGDVPNVDINGQDLTVNSTTLTIPYITLLSNTVSSINFSQDDLVINSVQIDGTDYGIGGDRRINIIYGSTTYSDALWAMNNGVPFLMDLTNGFFGMEARYDGSTIYFEFPYEDSNNTNQLVRYTLDTTGWSRMVRPQGIVSASIDSSGLITFSNNGQAQFTLQLPIYNGGVS